MVGTDSPQSVKTRRHGAQSIETESNGVGGQQAPETLIYSASEDVFSDFVCSNFGL